jgi:hypothetical protein
MWVDLLVASGLGPSSHMVYGSLLFVKYVQ